MLISLHLPKTAGSSFRMSLEDFYGSDLYADYSGMSAIQSYLAGEVPHKELLKRESLPLAYQCIHGHFIAMKWFEVFGEDSRNIFITWLRDPFSRLVSHYLFFRRTYNQKTAGPLFKKVIEEGWSFERFCLGEEFRNIYTKYLIGFPLERFDFIGISEYYASEMQYFSERFLGSAVRVHENNVGDRQVANEFLENLALKAQVEVFHAKDYDLYRRALDLRATRLK